MIIPSVHDVAFSIFGFSVYRYGIILAAAIFIGIICANYLFNIFYSDIKKDVILEFSPLIIIMGIFGARLYFCFLNPQYYFFHPLEIFDIREGGLSIHGGIIGGILSVLFMTKKYNIPLLKILDPMAASVILGQSIGRWGNYFNSEAYGLPVDGQNWGLYIPPQHRISGFEHYSLFHPTFLYESILDFCAFGLLTFIFLKFGKKYSGVTFFSYLLIYGLIRFFIELLRLDSALNIAAVPIASIVSVILFLIGLSGILFICKKS